MIMKQPIQVDALAILIGLEEKTRETLTVEELFFLIANETHNLTPYRQAIMLDCDGCPLTISGVTDFNLGSPFIHWLKNNISPYVRKLKKPCHIHEGDIIPDGSIDWNEWFPKFGFFLPLTSPVSGHIGSLFLLRDYPWNEDEQKVLGILAGAYGHAWGALQKPKKTLLIFKKSRFLKVLFLTCCLFVFAIPVPLTVLAPAEIVAVNPSVIRAPLDGVVEKILVNPNQSVNVGDPLFRMDAVSQRNELAIANKVYASLKAQYSQLNRIALSDSTSKKYLTETAGQIKQQIARIEYLKKLILRMNLSSLINGVVIIDDPSSWEGRPVNLGEKILSLADQTDVEIEAWLPIGDAIDLPKGSPMRVYLNSSPLVPIGGALISFSYEAQSKLGDIFAHRIRGRILDKEQLPRLGLRGTARIEGKKVSLLYWIFRRPLATLRQFFGM